jgi:hypothetical protein
MLALLLTLEKNSKAQSFAGVWKGESLCQDKNSSCHDEKVVYHISKGNSANSYQVDAGKIIDGKEIDMGTLNFVYDPTEKILFLADSANQVRWEFKLTGKEMHGTLISHGQLFRIVNLTLTSH